MKKVQNKIKVVVAKIAITTQHGAIEGETQVSETQFYNIDAIISVGYRVNSKKLRSFGYGHPSSERVRSIRASESRIWQRITDILAYQITGKFDFFANII